MQTLAEDPTFYATVNKWAVEFKHVMNSKEVDRRQGCPKSSSTDEQVDAVRRKVLGDIRLNVQQIDTSISIRSGSALRLLIKILGMSKL